MKDETLEMIIEELADECRDNGQNNLAIVLYSYLGSKKAGVDSIFAKHCQGFAKTGVKMIEKLKVNKTRRGTRGRRGKGR